MTILDGVLAGDGQLFERVMATAQSSLLAYIRGADGGGIGGGQALNMKSGGAPGVYGASVNRGGAFGMNGYPCPVFDGTASTSLIDILASLGGGWNGNLFSILAYGRLPVAGDWTNSALNFARIVDIRTDAANSFFVGKYDAANPLALSFELVAGGSSNFNSFSAGGTVDDFSLLVTHNRAANRFRINFNGGLIFSGASPGNWAGALTTAYIGASYAGFSNWKGRLYDVAIWNSELAGIA